MTKCYVYKVIRENVVTGKQGKRAKKYWGFEPLKVGGLYCLNCTPCQGHFEIV